MGVPGVAVDLTIGGVSYIEAGSPGEYCVAVDPGSGGLSLDVDLDIALQQPRAEFDVLVWSQAIARPKAGQEVIMLNASGQREFGGYLAMVQEYELEPTIMHYHCTCSDYTPIFNRHLVNGTFLSQLPAAFISTLAAQYANLGVGSEVFTTDNVQYNPAALPVQQFVYQPLSQVIQTITQMTGWGFYIDSYRDLHYYQEESFASPLPSNTLNADDLYSDASASATLYPNWVNLVIGEDVSQVKNRCYVSGILVAQKSLYTENFLGDGTTTTFSLGYQAPADTTSISVSVNGSPMQIGLDLIDSSPGGACDSGTVYVNFQQQTIRFCTAPASAAAIVVKYYPMQPIAVRVQSTAQQAVMAARTGTDGIFEYNRFDPSLSAELPSLAYARAQMTLQKYAQPYQTLHFDSFLQGWFPGQRFTFQSTRRFGGDYNGNTFHVNRVHKRVIKAASGAWTWQYTLDCANVQYEI